MAQSEMNGHGQTSDMRVRSSLGQIKTGNTAANFRQIPRSEILWNFRSTLIFWSGST